jgi:hypothetical protein
MDVVVVDEDCICNNFIQQILTDQYQCIEEYCNATTALHNTVQQQQQLASTVSKHNAVTASKTEIDASTTNLWASIDRYQKSVVSVQDSVRLLEQLVLNLETKKLDNNTASMPIQTEGLSTSTAFERLLNLPILRDHVQRTHRILRTIYKFGEGTSYYSNGISTPKSNDYTRKQVNVKLVALATLRASIQTVREALPP